MRLGTSIIILLTFVHLTSCTGKNQTTVSQNEKLNIDNLLKYIPCEDTVHNKLLSINVSTSDFSENSRTSALLSIRDNLKRNGIDVSVKIIIGKSYYTSQLKRLTRINFLDSIVTVVGDDSIEAMRNLINTRQPMVIFVNKDNSHIETGSIMQPQFKQKIYDYLYNTPMSCLSINDTVIKIKADTDTVIEIKNTAHNRLYIYDIETSCECSKVYVDKSELAEGECARLFIQYKKYSMSKGRTNILIYSNNLNGTKEIILESLN